MDQDASCYICLGDASEKGGFIERACECTGTIKIHLFCIFEQMDSGFSNCGACKTVFLPIMDGKPIKSYPFKKGFKKYIQIWQCSVLTNCTNYRIHNKDLDGIFKIWNISVEPEVLVKQGQYVHNQMDGEFIEWSEHKSRYYISSKTNYSKGKLHGLRAIYYPNGVANTIATYENNNKCGLFVRRYENNVIIQQCNYVNGKIEGAFESYYPNGKIDIICTYKDDKLHGLYKKWRADGSLHTECVYDHGTRVPIVVPVVQPLTVQPLTVEPLTVEPLVADEEPPLPAITAAIPRTHTFMAGRIIARRNSIE